MAAAAAASLLLLHLLLFLPFLLILSAHVHVASGRRALGSSTASSTASQFLEPHNKLRKSTGVPALQWNTTLARYARWYADRRRGDCELTHSTSDYGENLFWGQGKGWSVGDAVAAWAAEKKYYDYKTNSCLDNYDCLHYTQMVWKATRRLGCAKIYCDSGDTYVVCEYDPHGNVSGSRPY